MLNNIKFISLCVIILFGNLNVSFGYQENANDFACNDLTIDIFPSDIFSQEYPLRMNYNSKLSVGIEIESIELILHLHIHGWPLSAVIGEGRISNNARLNTALTFESEPIESFSISRNFRVAIKELVKRALMDGLNNMATMITENCATGYKSLRLNIIRDMLVSIPSISSPTNEEGNTEDQINIKDVILDLFFNELTAEYLEEELGLSFHY